MSIVNDTLKTEFETWGKLEPEDSNTLFLKTAEIVINGKIDRDLEDSDLEKAPVKSCLFMLAMMYSNSRDFISKQDMAAVNMQAMVFLAGLDNLSRYIPEGSDA